MIIQLITESLTIEEMIAARLNEIDSGWIKQGARTLVIVKTDVINLTQSDLRSYTEWSMDNLVPLQDSRSAVVVDSPIATAMSVLFQNALSSIRKMQVFSALESAGEWLSVPVEAIIEAAPEAQCFAST